MVDHARNGWVCFGAMMLCDVCANRFVFVVGANNYTSEVFRLIFEIKLLDMSGHAVESRADVAYQQLRSNSEIA